MAGNFKIGGVSLDDIYLTEYELIDKYIGGTIWTTGSNAAGSLGDGTLVNKSSPVRVGSLTTWRDISLGYNHMAALKTDNTLWVWGQANDGKLGLGSNFANISSPVQLGAGTNWKQVSASVDCTLAIKIDGTLWAWGNNDHGKLGLNDISYRSSPVQVGSLTTWSKVYSGSYTTLAIKIDGTLWGWGYNSDGQLNYFDGIGTNGTVLSPTQVGGLADWKTGQTDINNLASNASSSLLIKENGTLWGWGLNNEGNLGLGNLLQYSSPVQIGILSNWGKISSSHENTLAIKTDGTLWSWGNNSYGQLGTSGSTISSPIQIGNSTDWHKCSTSNYLSMFIKTDGTLWASGLGFMGRLGLGHVINISSPTQVGTLTNWLDVSVGVNLVTAIKTDGTLWTWGRNDWGALGDSSGTSKSSPVQVGSLTDWKQVSTTSGYTAAAVKTDGTLWLWGYHADGLLAGVSTTQLSSPVQLGVLTNWSYVKGGKNYFIAVKTDGTLWGWGSNTLGSLGENVPLGSIVSSPVQLNSYTDWLAVNATDMHCVGTRGSSTATLWAWGSNNYGRLGYLAKGLVSQSSPVQISGNSWADFSVGDYHILLKKTDGTLWSIGWNSIGELGLSDNTARSSPVQLGSLNNWKYIHAAANSSYAIRDDGALFSWGSGSSGRLGNSSNTSYNSPRQVGALTDWKEVHSSHGLSRSIAAVKKDGTLWVWGEGSSYGSFGLNNTSINYSSPVQVGTDANWVKASLSANNLLGLRYNTI